MSDSDVSEKAPLCDQVPRELGEYRASIDNLDAALVHLLAERFRVTRKVGELKRQEALPPADEGREERQLLRLKEIATTAGLDPTVVDLIFPALMSEVRRRHQELRGDGPRPL
ncbi:chorismate mutase [Alkalispirochaeta americana]|uniref:chorismate mutase n=1 Tax=Alkalispirochaeta americana TaxID=159291 RepID=UPI001F3CF09C|nr:chorismate mutase [Alkalispirochaeta americana]